MGDLVFWLSFLLVFTVACAGQHKYRVVETKSGQVRGIRETSFLKNVDFYSFRGIPYAEAPVGELRFKVSTFIALPLTVFKERFFQRHLNQLSHGHRKLLMLLNMAILVFVQINYSTSPMIFRRARTVFF